MIFYHSYINIYATFDRNLNGKLYLNKDKLLSCVSSSWWEPKVFYTKKPDKRAVVN